MNTQAPQCPKCKQQAFMLNNLKHALEHGAIWFCPLCNVEVNQNHTARLRSELSMKQRRRSIGTRGKIKFDTAREQAIKWVARYIAGMGMDVSEVDGKQAFIALSDACKIAPETYAAAFSDEASERQYKFFIRDWEIYRRDHRRI